MMSLGGEFRLMIIWKHIQGTITQRAQLRPDRINIPQTIARIFTDRAIVKSNKSCDVRVAGLPNSGDNAAMDAMQPTTINNQLIIVIESGRVFNNPYSSYYEMH
jgi:hypothetical protein